MPYSMSCPMVSEMVQKVVDVDENLLLQSLRMRCEFPTFPQRSSDYVLTFLHFLIESGICSRPS